MKILSLSLTILEIIVLFLLFVIFICWISFQGIFWFIDAKYNVSSVNINAGLPRINGIKNRMVHIRRIKENNIVAKSINISSAPNDFEFTSIEKNITHSVVSPNVINGTEIGEYLTCWLFNSIRVFKLFSVIFTNINFFQIKSNKKGVSLSTNALSKIYLILNQSLLCKQRIAAHHLRNIRFDLR